MTTELTAMWQTIAEAYPYALDAIPRSSQPSDGQPTGTKVEAPSPVNDTAQSWCAEVEQAAFGWGEATNVDDNIRWLTQHTPDADKYALNEFTALTERLAKEAQHFIPAHTKTARLPPEQIANLYCATIQELTWALNSLGHTTPINTVKSWVHRGHINKTPAGYSLAQAHARASA